MLRSRYHLSFIGRTTARTQFKPFGIWRDDRLFHTHVIGKSGTGKSTLLETLIAQDIRYNRGCLLIDPHGDLAEKVAARALRERGDDVIYFDLADPNQPYSFNPLKRVPADKMSLAASGLLEVFKKMWSDAWGVKLEHILRNALYALLETPHATLPDLLRILTDDDFRVSVAGQVSNKKVRDFWLNDYPKPAYRSRSDVIAPIENKIAPFLTDPLMHSILTEPREPISIRRCMDEQKVLLVNLAKGKIGGDTAELMGGLLVTTLGLAALSRADIPEAKRKPFFAYIDEFGDYSTNSMAGMISEIRKFKVGLIVAHQYMEQLTPPVRAAILGNAGTLISFRLGAKDAPTLVKEFQSHNVQIEPTDIMSLPNHNIYIKLMIDREVSKPFSAETLQAHELFNELWFPKKRERRDKRGVMRKLSEFT